jgi:hypothetical protein
VSIGIGIVIWLDSSSLRQSTGGQVRGGLITRAYATKHVVTRGYYLRTGIKNAMITRGYGARTAVTRGMGG